MVSINLFFLPGVTIMKIGYLLNNPKCMTFLLFITAGYMLQATDYTAQLFHAVKTNNKTATKKLLKRNLVADINVRNIDGKTVLDIAAEAKNKRLVPLLVQAQAKVTTEQNAETVCELLLNPHKICWILAAIFAPIATLALFVALLIQNPFAYPGIPIVGAIMLTEIIGFSTIAALKKHNYIPSDFMLEPARSS